MPSPAGRCRPEVAVELVLHYMPPHFVCCAALLKEVVGAPQPEHPAAGLAGKTLKAPPAVQSSEGSGSLGSCWSGSFALCSSSDDGQAGSGKLIGVSWCAVQAPAWFSQLFRGRGGE